jgi:predicted metalloprotease with PDZ domain
MHPRLILVFVITLFSTQVTGQTKEPAYRYTVDLTRVVNDRVYVELSPPSGLKSEVTFYLPKVIPGTYATADYGRYVSEFKATDKKGKSLPVEKTDANTWKIKSAEKISKISYWVDDSFDTKIDGPEIFWPAGTNIEENKNVILNTSGFLGYFSGKTEIPFEFNVIRPKEWYGTTGLVAARTGVTPAAVKLEKISNEKTKLVDVYRTVDYDELIDSPLMYSKPDTAIIRVGNTEVLIGSYSPTNQITAKEIAGSIETILMAQKEFLKGKLPVDKYAFIFYFTDQPVTSYGALEHSYSSMYYMPEAPIAMLGQELQDIAAHEFFHIMTPLTVHSEEIGFFDYNDPKMSQHLWMYEGVTEYFASLVQVKNQLITPQQYLFTIREKIFNSKEYNDALPFTDLSKYTLDKYHDQYNNVYQKGALIGLCLDLQLLKSSKGKYNLRDLILDLSKKYGKTKSFKDDDLIPEITKMTFPEIGEFFKKYVQGGEPLPLTESLASAGVTYKAEDRTKDYSLGINQFNIGVAMVENQLQLIIAATDNLNDMGKKLGFQQGDVLMQINGENIPAIAAPGDSIPNLGPDFGVFIQKQTASLPTAPTLSFTIKRLNAAGKYEDKLLTAPVTQVEIVRPHWLALDPNATAEQLAIREAWLGPDKKE